MSVTVANPKHVGEGTLFKVRMQDEAVLVLLKRVSRHVAHPCCKCIFCYDVWLVVLRMRNLALRYYVCLSWILISCFNLFAFVWHLEYLWWIVLRVWMAWLDSKDFCLTSWLFNLRTVFLLCWFVTFFICFLSNHTLLFGIFTFLTS